MDFFQIYRFSGLLFSHHELTIPSRRQIYQLYSRGVVEIPAYAFAFIVTKSNYYCYYIKSDNCTNSKAHKMKNRQTSNSW